MLRRAPPTDFAFFGGILRYFNSTMGTASDAGESHLSRRTSTESESSLSQIQTSRVRPSIPDSPSEKSGDEKMYSAACTNQSRTNSSFSKKSNTLRRHWRVIALLVLIQQSQREVPDLERPKVD